MLQNLERLLTAAASVLQLSEFNWKESTLWWVGTAIVSGVGGALMDELHPFWLAVGVIVISTCVTFIVHLRKANKRQPENEAVSRSASNGVTPRWGCIRQGASERHRSWWHLQVNVMGGNIDNAYIDVLQDPALNLQWRQTGNRQGARPLTLVEGRNYLVPFVVRDDPDALNRLPACITGTAFLVDGNHRKFVLTPGQRKFQFVITDGKNRWESPQYLLNVPPDDQTNSQFWMERYHENRDA